MQFRPCSGWNHRGSEWGIEGRSTAARSKARHPRRPPQAMLMADRGFLVLPTPARTQRRSMSGGLRSRLVGRSPRGRDASSHLVDLRLESGDPGLELVERLLHCDASAGGSCSDMRGPGAKVKFSTHLRDGPFVRVEASIPSQLSMANPMQLVGFGAQAASAIGLVFLVVSCEPYDAAVALEGQRVRRDAVEEPTVV